MTTPHTSRSVSPPPAPKVPAPPSKRRRAGFTVIELWVVLLVLVFVAGLSLSAFRGKAKRATLQRSRGGIASDLRLMREYSLSGKSVSVCTTPVKTICPSNRACTCANEVPAGGFGAYFETCLVGTRCTYYLFADLNADGEFSPEDDFDHDGIPDELLPNGERAMEPQTIVNTLLASYPSQGKYDANAQVTFAAFTGSAKLGGSSDCCSGSSGGGSTEYRISEILTVGPSVGTPVKVIMKSGDAGIQEQF